MDTEKRFCPFKKQVRIGYSNGMRKISDLFVKCSGSNCMAYKNGICLRIEENTKKKAR